ncbi:MAG: tRNA lysidine(34) synthetase TilS [Clostridia bacterium]|nr:tRNA lysidine(34) synthetase TilS [Clostridia bacterium]
MDNKALQTIHKYHMLRQGDRIVVGLSGGADSCALLHFLVSLRKEMDLTIDACHVNHMLRGQEADRDEQFAAKLCEKYHITLLTQRVDVAAMAKRKKISTELCARNVRYDFFARIADQFSAKIATAHTASDNAETVLFHLARGSGISGLCGIPPVRDNIIRPLIECTRSDTERYCRDNHIDYVTDSTNLQRDYTRNRLRLDVVPVLKTINPSFEMSVTAMSQRMREADEFLAQCARQALSEAQCRGGYDTVKLSALDNIVFSEAIRLLLKEFHIVPEAKHIELVRKIVYNSGAVEIRKNITAVSEQGILRIVCREAIKKTREKIPFGNQKTIFINDKKFQLDKINLSEFHNRKKNNKFVFHNSVDYDTIPLTAVFRTRRSGDQFKPLGRNITKPLRKLMTEQKIPSEQRDSLVLLADDSEIIWAEHLGVSELYRVTPQTHSVLCIAPTGRNDEF